jgi:hypothetical protein
LTRRFAGESVGGQSEKGETMAATRDDAMLLVELSKLGAMMKLDQASRTVFADDFDPDGAEVTDPSVQALLFFYETIGTLVKNGLFDRDLVYDWLWAAGVWAKIGPAAARARAKAGVPELFENFEALAAGQGLGAGAAT